MRLARKYDHRGRAFKEFECAEQLLAPRVLRSAIVRLPQNKHHGSMYLLDKSNGGAIGIVLGILERRRFKPVRLEQSEIGGVPPRSPVRDVTLRYGSREAIGLRNCPIGKHSPATAAGYPKLLRIHVAALENFIDSGHQIAVIVARIAILDDVAEFLAIARRSARIRIEHHIALRRHPLKFMIENPSVSSMRPAMNVEDKRIFFLGVKVRWFLNPTLNPQSIEALVINLFGSRKVELRPECFIRVGDADLRP